MDNEKLNILKLLIENKREFSIRELSIKRDINYKSAYNAVKKLNNLINKQEKGNITLISFNYNFNESVFIVENHRKNELIKNKNLKILYNRLKPIKQQFILLVFGSYAKKTKTKHSDIDLLLVSNNPKEIEQEINLLPLNIHLTDIHYDEFDSMLKSKEFSIVSEAQKSNVILFGIEDYYRLINHG